MDMSHPGGHDKIVEPYPNGTWLYRIHMRPNNPPVVPLSQDPNSYYAGAQSIYFAVVPPNSSKDDMGRVEADLKQQISWPIPNFTVPTLGHFVQQYLYDPKAVVLKTAFARHTHSTHVALSLHSIDLDVELEKPDKTALRALLSDRQRPVPTLQEIIDKFPAYQVCWSEACTLQKAARSQGRTVAIISTGWKGFRILIHSAPELYLWVKRESIKGSMKQVRKLVQPALCDFFGTEDLPSCIDYSVWGESKGVRTNLHPHPATGLWPLVMEQDIDAASQPYGSAQANAHAQAAIREFWTGCLSGVSEIPETIASDNDDDDGEKEESTGNAKKRKPSKLKSAVKKALPSSPKKSKKKKQKTSAGICDFEGIPIVPVVDPCPVEDSFADVVELLATQGWVPQESSLHSASPGASQVCVYIDRAKSSASYECVKTGRVHASNTFKVRVNRITGDLQVICADPECDEPDYRWPILHTVGHLGANPLFQLLVNAKGLLNQADIAVTLAPTVKTVLAYDPSCSRTVPWRVYKAESGTWHKCASLAEPQMLVRAALVTQLAVILDQLHQLHNRLPSRSCARKGVNALLCTFQRYEHQSGAKPFMAQLASMIEPLVTVTKDEWRSHFHYHLPVANALLHFCITTGVVQALPYKPEYHVCNEYQAPILWAEDWPALGQHAGVEGLLNDWWDEDERASWLQCIAYALSRSCFAEKIFFMWGPGGSAKSSACRLLATWFGTNNVFVHTSCALIVQNAQKSRHEDDGKGHDTALVECFDKAIVQFPEPPDGSFLRDDVVKRMTGDNQTGRRAYSSTLESVRRAFTPFVVCNSIPRPQNATDTAMVSRMEILTTHRVFYRSDDHRKDVEARMTPQQKKEAQFIRADSSKVTAVESDPVAGSYFLHLLSAHWFRLVAVQQRNFKTTPRAEQVKTAFISSLRRDQDSVVAFLEAEVARNDDAVLPKISLWLAYGVWFQQYSKMNGSPGPLVKSEDAFKKRVASYYEHASLKSTQRKARVFELRQDTMELYLGHEQSKVRCYVGIELQPNARYPVPEQPLVYLPMLPAPAK